MGVAPSTWEPTPLRSAAACPPHSLRLSQRKGGSPRCLLWTSPNISEPSEGHLPEKWLKQPFPTLLGPAGAGSYSGRPPGPECRAWAHRPHQSPGPVPTGGPVPQGSLAPMGSCPCPRQSPVCPESGGTAGVGSKQPREPSRGNQARRRTPGTGEPGAFPAPPAQLTWPLPPSQALGAEASPALWLPDWMGEHGDQAGPQASVQSPLEAPPLDSAETPWGSEARVCTAHWEGGPDATCTHP